MKNLTLFVIIMTLGMNTIIAQNYLQDPKTGEIIIKEPFKKINVKFDSNVPEYVKRDAKIMEEITKKSNKILSATFVKGQYSTFILYYTPKRISQIVYRNQDSKDIIRISYNKSFEEEGRKNFSWWYLFWIIGLIAMRLVQKSEGDGSGDGAAMVATVCSCASIYMLMSSTCPAPFPVASMLMATLVSVVGVVSVVVAKNSEEKISKNTFTNIISKPHMSGKSISAFIYYTCVMIAAVCTYYQV